MMPFICVTAAQRLVCGSTLPGLRSRRDFVKAHIFNCAIAIGFLGLAGSVCFGQPSSTSAPIKVQLSATDRCQLWVTTTQNAAKMNMPAGAYVCLPFKEDKQLMVDALIGGETNLNRLVWVTDGDKVLAKGKFGGRCVLLNDMTAHESESGLCLRFDADGEAQAAKSLLGATHDEQTQWDMRHLDERIAWQKKQLDNPRCWIP